MENLRLDAEQLREKNWLLQDQLDDIKKHKDSRCERAAGAPRAGARPARASRSECGRDTHALPSAALLFVHFKSCFLFQSQVTYSILLVSDVHPSDYT